MRLLLICVLLAGCATPSEKAEKMTEKYGPVCDRLGYPSDTDKWRDCVLSQANAHTMRQRAGQTQQVKVQ